MNLINNLRSVIEYEAKRAGVDKFLSKPLFPSAIADIINECVGYNHKPEEAASDENGDAVDFNGYRILLAEDMDINREIVMALLESTNIKIDCAENGYQAVDLFEQQPERYDIIFMDVQMPEMDGYEATRRIRMLEADEAKRVPIIAMTANVFKEDVEKCIAAGMNDHIGKPLDSDDLMKVLHRYLSKKDKTLY